MAIWARVAGFSGQYWRGSVEADGSPIPILEPINTISNSHPCKRVETATWDAPSFPRGPLRIPGRNIWNHYLDKNRFDLIRDDTNYLSAP